MKYVDRSMLRIGCLRQLPMHWQYVHSTNISKCKREPKDFKGFIRFAHELYFLQEVFPSLKKKISVFSNQIGDQPQKADTLLTTFISPEGHSGSVPNSSVI